MYLLSFSLSASPFDTIKKLSYGNWNNACVWILFCVCVSVLSCFSENVLAITLNEIERKKQRYREASKQFSHFMIPESVIWRTLFPDTYE